MKHEQSAPAGYRPRFAGTMKLYLVRHKEYGATSATYPQLLIIFSKLQKTSETAIISI